MIKSGIYKKGEKELIKLIEHITNKKTIEKSGAITHSKNDFTSSSAVTLSIITLKLTMPPK